MNSTFPCKWTNSPRVSEVINPLQTKDLHFNKHIVMMILVHPPDGWAIYNVLRTRVVRALSWAREVGCVILGDFLSWTLCYRWAFLLQLLWVPGALLFRFRPRYSDICAGQHRRIKSCFLPLNHILMSLFVSKLDQPQDRGTKNSVHVGAIFVCGEYLYTNQFRSFF